MSKMKSYFGVLMFAFFISSCSPTLYPFTGDIYDNFNNQEQLSKVQFYLSGDIVLYRDYGGRQTSIENGTIKMINGRKVEEVFFKKGTPGIVLFSPKRDRIAVCFENNDNNYLMFGPSPKMDNRFVLLAKEWKRNRGKVTYGGEIWNTTSESAYSSLLVDMDRVKKTKFNKKTVGGRKVER